MLGLKTKKELATDAHTLARGSQLVRYHGITYMPVDFETPDPDQIPEPERCTWVPLSREDIRIKAADTFDTLFGSDGELSSFEFMVAQNSLLQRWASEGLLIRTEQGLRYLNEEGELVEPDGRFVANTIGPALNTNDDDKAEVMATIVEWLDSEEEAESLLQHLATALAPGWSAVKYVLFLGEGRNGKSVLLKMLQRLFGRTNVSSVTRQQIAEQSPTVTELNGKLLNIVFDGRAEYLKDSGTEKSLIAGEEVTIRKLYESSPTVVSTNALFLEGLNHEPKSKDKSTALQKRLVRFQFPNVYALDLMFEKKMLSEKYLGALLSLLIDRYVKEEEVAAKLAPTQKAIELQLEHMYANSFALQYIKYLEESATAGAIEILGQTSHELAAGFKAWRLKENDLGTWTEPDVLAMFTPLVNTERKSQRVGGVPRKVRVITSFKEETDTFINSLKGQSDDAEILAVVED